MARTFKSTHTPTSASWNQIEGAVLCVLGLEVPRDPGDSYRNRVKCLFQGQSSHKHGK